MPGESPRQQWSNEIAKYDVAHLRLRQIANLLTDVEPRKIIDFGCATGRLREECPWIDEYIGVDFVDTGRSSSFPFVCCDFNSESFPSSIGKCDAAVCSGILEYIQDVPSFLSSVHSVLEPNGTLVATYFNMQHVLRRCSRIFSGHAYEHKNWRNQFPARSIETLLSESGFRTERIVPTRHSLRHSGGVRSTVSMQTRIPRLRPWSWALSHQFIFVARAV